MTLAEGRGTYAFLLGAGVSRDAEVPTGSEIFWDTVGKLHHMETDATSSIAPRRQELNEWFEQSAYSEFGYSEILEALFPSKEERRQYLSRFFINKKPGNAHLQIVELVKANLVRLVVTTNFDRLLEQSLERQGLEFDAVYSSDDFGRLRPREHSPCRILKLHGDYQNLNMKNTPRELESLDAEIESEFGEIVNRHGLVVIGYSGRDPGVMRVLTNRNSK